VKVTVGAMSIVTLEATLLPPGPLQLNE
jgi:hypothetical protein